VFALEPGVWQGPLASAYGFHLVRVREHQAAQPRSLAEARHQVLEEWHREQQTRAKEQFFALLLKKYDVVVDEAVKPFLKPVLN
jgi:parvulin-like peptidyl-prolyl isomerase